MKLNEIYEAMGNEATKESLMEMGWMEMASEPKKIKAFTNSLLNAIRQNIPTNERETNEMFSKITFQGQDRRDREYGKTFKRIVLGMGKNEYTLICNLSGAGAKYLVYEKGKNTVLASYSNLKDLGEYLYEVFS